MPLIQKNRNRPKSNVENGSPKYCLKQFSVEDLEEKSKTLARILRDSGCKKGEPICCVMDKSIDLLISIWGIRYAGCEAFPIDPHQPVNHIQSIILESRSEWLMIDRWAESLVRSNRGQNPLNIGWMDTIETIPDNCLPEFVRDNINHISLHPVFGEPDKGEPVISFMSLTDSQMKRNTFTGDDIKTFVSPIIETLKLDASSRIAGLTTGNSPSLLLELMSLFHVESSLFLFDYPPESFFDELVNEINEQQLTHLFLEASQINATEGSDLQSAYCHSIEKIVIWGQKPPIKKLEKLMRVFPRSDIYTISEGSDEPLSIHPVNSKSVPFEIANQKL